MLTNAYPQSAVIIPFPNRQLSVSGRDRSIERSPVPTQVCSEAFDSWYHQAAIDEDTAKKS
ncbi:DUF2735 domain-containing protein [Aureimonas pseudogalii]|uniref:DUF2735 domain-containing protein n=1 Tax=Aureimonas pseudogalii TaxID=1744844 RepID=A0A7W6MM10_9HYPH|nr:DUF2735 domain-containing protein [Aureimonas pseudogalii]MBB4000362.1 hypothetical protein [Aureimonas pseudogalii]